MLAQQSEPSLSDTTIHYQKLLETRWLSFGAVDCCTFLKSGHYWEWPFTAGVQDVRKWNWIMRRLWVSSWRETGGRLTDIHDSPEWLFRAGSFEAGKRSTLNEPCSFSRDPGGCGRTRTEMKLHAVQDGDQGTVREDTYRLIMETLWWTTTSFGDRVSKIYKGRWTGAE